jgi:hypothetical protein
MSNLGHEVPDDVAEDIPEGSSRFPVTPRLEIENLAGHLMESEEYEDIFAEEAEGWYETLSKMSSEDILTNYTRNPWVSKIVEA